MPKVLHGNPEGMKKRKLQPPVYLGIYLLVAIILHFVLPLKKIVHSPYNYTGVLFLGIGIWLNIWADSLFKRKNAPVKAFEKMNYFISGGPFRFSRNPMYLGMVLILSGVAVLLGNIISFIVPIGFFITMNIVFISYEEKALEETFGTKFFDYKKRVRSWL
ncbi:MAG: isoprenylcysteine carboxylmethyltransferase family protein [Candidatus Omnitrophica bacterium]|nr:isoprenylcysteine carboxylmethyltransferase family protein [Candidatus Omnitrophota bacterium]